MAQTVILVSVLFGFALVATVLILARGGWREYTPSFVARSTAHDKPSLTARAATDPTVWVLAFVAAILVFGGATIAFVSGASVPEQFKQIGGAVLVGGSAAVFVVYVFYGTFTSALGRGMHKSQAALFGSWALGLLFIVLLVVKLMGMI